MSVILLIVLLLALAGIWWLVNNKFPTPNPFKWVINIILIVAAGYLVLTAIGVWSEVKSLKVPTV